MDDKSKKSHSIRIDKAYYEALKDSAEKNKRTISSELSFILDEHFDLEPKINFKEREKAFKALCGIIDDMPPDNYSTSIDDVLYGNG